MILRIKVLALLYGLFVLGGSPNAVAQTTSIAANNQVLFGGQYYDSAGNVQTGTMSNQGNWNMNTTAFPGAGYYSGLTSTITPANVCSGTAVFGAAGAAACEGGTTSSPAGTANILSGEQAWDATGTELTGTMVNQGALNAADSFPGAGYYNGTVTNAPSASQIISGSTILGVAGTSTGSFSLNTASNANRDAGVAVVPQLAGQTTSTQFNLNSEITTYGASDLPSSSGYSYRDIPNTTKDDDGYLGTTCDFAPRPTTNCGTTQSTIALRIANCVSVNPTTSSWNGSTQCNRGQGSWSLVTRDGANEEVWQDNRNGLIWSSKVSTSLNYCQASGNTQLAPVTFVEAYNNAAGTPIVGTGTLGSISGGSSSLGETITVTFTSSTAFTVTSTGNGCSGGSQSGALTTTAGSTATWSRANYCSFTLTQGATPWAANDTITLGSIAASSYSCYPGSAAGLQPASPLSYCAEAGGAFTSYPTGENWPAGTYMAAKGLMGANSAPAVHWRLPSREDYEQADVDGIRMVMPDMGVAGANRPNIDGSTGAGSTTGEWSASMRSISRISGWQWDGAVGTNYWNYRSMNFSVRCVGR